ncbi:MAG: hypothetical protein GY839_17895 [candidate division Zixibacteria bacterium]|nr:hypothetical protein [candidate division Zixibacteria bacterium]
MRRTFLHKWLALLFSLLFIITTTCSAPASKINVQKPKFFTLDLAKKIADNSTLIRKTTANDIHHDYILLGWGEEGFIVTKNDLIDTLSYDSIGFKILVNTGKRKTGKGAWTGCMIGGGCSLLTILATQQSVKTDPSDMAGMRWVVAGYAIVAIMGLATVTGAAMGSARFEYDEYKYDKNYFADNPWLSMKYHQKAAVNELHEKAD